MDGWAPIGTSTHTLTHYVCFVIRLMILSLRLDELLEWPGSNVDLGMNCVWIMCQVSYFIFCVAGHRGSSTDTFRCATDES